MVKCLININRILCFKVLIVFVCIEVQRPSQYFFQHVGTKPTFPWVNQYYRELMCLAQGHNRVPLVGSYLNRSIKPV